MFQLKLNRKSHLCGRILALCITPLFFTFNLFGQATATEARELKFGKLLERKIERGDLHEYKLALRSGQVLFVELEEQTYNVKIELVKAIDKKSVAETDLGAGLDRENLIFAAEESGDYLLRIEAAENQFGDGSYRFSARLTESLSETDKTRIEALRLLREAAVLQKENTAVKIREAISRREQTLALWQKIGDKYWEGRTLDRLGTAHNTLLENNKAVDYLNRAFQIVKESGDKPLEAATLNTIGSMTNGFGEHQQAIEYHNQALQIFEKLKNKVGIMSSFNFLGNAYIGLKDYPKADEFLQKTLEMSRKEKNKNFEASGLYFLGVLLDAQNEKQKALEKYSQSLELWRVIKSEIGVALAFYKKGQIQNQQGKTDEALSNLEESLKLAKLKKIRGLESDIYFELSTLHYRSKKIFEAIEFLKKSIDFWREFQLRALEIIQTGTLAIYYENLPDYKEAIKYAETALAIEEIVPEKWSVERNKRFKDSMKNSKAMTLQTLARISFNSGDTEKALQYYYQVLAMVEGKDDKDSKHRIVDSLGSIAQIHQYRYEWDKALENYNRSLQIDESLENDLIYKVRKLLTLNSIGLVYNRIGEKKKALEFFEKALNAIRLIPERDDFAKNFEAVILNNIGLIYHFFGEPKKALENYEESLAIQEKINDLYFIDSLALTYGNLAEVYSFLGENKKSLELIQKSLELYRQTPQKVKDLARNRSIEATVLNNLGLIYKMTGDFRKAFEYYNQSLNIAIDKKREDTESSALNNIALIYQAYGEPQKALENFNKALAIERKLRDGPSESLLLNNIGQLYSDLGEERKNIEYTTQALQIAEKTGNKSFIATCLNNLGRAYNVLSEHEKALNYFERALKIHEETGNKSGKAISFNNFAILYSNIGERGKAIDFFEKALTIIREIGDKATEATVYGNIAVDYLELGEYENALEYREKSLKISREISDKAGEIYQLNGISAIYRIRGEKEKNSEFLKRALNLSEQALKLSRETENKYGEYDALVGIGKIYVELNETTKALPYLNEALIFAKKTQNRFLEDGVRFALATLHEKNGTFNKAIEEYQQAFTVARTINDKDIEARALKGLMSAWKAKKNNHLAIFYGKQSVDKYQELRGSIRNLKRATQDVFRDKITDVYRELADLLIEAGRLPEAEQVLAMLKEQETFDFVRRDGSEAKDLLSQNVFLNDRETEAVREYVRLADELVAKSQQKNELEQKINRSAEENEKLKSLKIEVDRATAGINYFFSKLEKEFTKKVEEDETITAKTINRLRTELREVRKESKEEVILISTYLLPERYRVIISNGETMVDRKKEYESLNLNGAAVNKKISEFKKALQNPQENPRLLGKELYDIFIEPLEKDIRASKAKTILWSLDGNLRYIPIGALFDGEKYLAERFQNVVVTLGRTEKLFDQPSRSNWRILGLGVSKQYQDFRGLPAVPGELRAIIRDERKPQESGGVLPGIGLLNEEFTNQSFVGNLKPNASGKRFNAIHLATHFRLSGKWDDSGLLLGDGSILSLRDIDENSDFDFIGVELLTLSACETGVSVGDGGEVESLGLLVQRKGAKSVLATLWKVADASTAMLMSEFYRLRQANPTWTKAKALQEAQLAMISGKLNLPTEGCENRAEIVGGSKNQKFSVDKCKQFAHPYYWSPFILIGNWK